MSIHDEAYEKDGRELEWMVDMEKEGQFQ